MGKLRNGVLDEYQGKTEILCKWAMMFFLFVRFSCIFNIEWSDYEGEQRQVDSGKVGWYRMGGASGELKIGSKSEGEQMECKG